MLAIYIIVAVLVVAYLGRKAMEQSKPFVLDTDERRIAEMYGKTRDVKLRGFITGGSAREGKLVLTSKRLIYTRYDEMRHALSITPPELASIDVGETGLLRKSPALILSYTSGGKQEAKTITWSVPEQAKVAGIFLVKSYDNPNTAETFATLLEKWRRGELRHSNEVASKSSPAST